MRVPNTIALALVSATAAALKKQGDVPSNWIARRVAQKVDQTQLGTHVEPGVKVNSSRGTFVRG